MSVFFSASLGVARGRKTADKSGQTSVSQNATYIDLDLERAQRRITPENA